MATAILCGSAAEALGQGGGGQKFAYVDSRIIVDRAPGRAAAESQLKKESEEMEAKVKVWQDSLNAMITAYQAAEKTLTEAQRQTRQKAIADRQADYAKRAEALDAQMNDRRAELSQPIMAQIKETLDAVRVEDGYAFIFDVAAGGVIVAADKNLDLTEKVIGRLRPIAVAPKADTAKAPAAKATPAGVRKPPTQ